MEPCCHWIGTKRINYFQGEVISGPFFFFFLDILIFKIRILMELAKGFRRYNRNAKRSFVIGYSTLIHQERVMKRTTFIGTVLYCFQTLDWASLKESICNVGDLGLIPGLGISPGEVKGYPLQYFHLENSIVHGVSKSRTQLRDFKFTFGLNSVKINS